MQANITMVTSGKGGTGKSTISAFLAGELSAMNKKILLVELDSGLRSVDIISGVYGRTVYDIEDVLSGACEGDKAVVQSPNYPGLSVLSAPVSGGVILPETLKVFCDKMRPYFDEIVLDTAAGLEAPFHAARAVSNRAIIIVNPDPVSLRDGRIVSDILYDDNIVMRMIINRLQPWRLKGMGIADLDECIDLVAARLLGVVPESDNIAQSAATGEVLPKDSREKEIFRRMAHRLCGDELPLVVDSY